MKLSILDLVSVSQGQTVSDAIEAAMRAAELADELGYERVWYAEHHNTAAVASSATALLIGGTRHREHSASGWVLAASCCPTTRRSMWQRTSAPCIRCIPGVSI